VTLVRNGDDVTLVIAESAPGAESLLIVIAKYTTVTGDFRLKVRLRGAL
jgi:hypothetical protein